MCPSFDLVHIVLCVTTYSFSDYWITWSCGFDETSLWSDLNLLIHQTAQIYPAWAIFLYYFSLLFYYFYHLFLLSAPLLLKIFPLKIYKNIVISLIVIYFFIVFILHLLFITLHHLMHILFPCHFFLLSLSIVCI